MIEGIHYYIEKGYKVFTRAFHVKRGFCCNNGCRHCAWKLKNNKMTTEEWNEIFPNTDRDKEDLFIDMDGVLCDFEGKVKISKGVDETHPDWEKIKEDASNEEGFFSDLPPMDGAIDAFHELSKHFNVFILSTPAWDSPSSYMEKRLWVEKHLGYKASYKKLILSHHKNQHTGRALIDDRTKNGAGHFKGEHIHFATEKFPDWKTVLTYLIPKS